VVFKLAEEVNRWVRLDLDTAVLVSIPAFLLMVPIGYLAYHLVEKRALQFRVNYLIPRQPAAPPARPGGAVEAVTIESAGHTGRAPGP
jgi:peptidoglycan/LPS O-acetylase OafA/YrhL